MSRRRAWILGLLPLELGHAYLHGWLIHAVLDGGHDAVDGSLDLGERVAVGIGLAAALVVLAVQLLVVGTHCLGDGLRRHQPVRQAGEHPLLDHGAADRAAVTACAAPMVVEAAAYFARGPAHTFGRVRAPVEPYRLQRGITLRPMCSTTSSARAGESRAPQARHGQRIGVLT